MVEETLINTVEQGRLDTILASNGDMLAKFTGVKEVLMRRAIANTSTFTPIITFDKKQVDIILEEVRFEKELG